MRSNVQGVTTVKEVEHVAYASSNCIDNRRAIFNPFSLIFQEERNADVKVTRNTEYFDDVSFEFQ